MSVAIALLTLLDVFLSDAQKRQISDSAVRVWNFLDEMKRIPFLNWLKHRAAQRALVAVASAIAAIPIIYVLWSFFSLESHGNELVFNIVTLIVFGAGTGLGIWFGPRIAEFLLRSATSVHVVWKLAVVFILALIPLAGFMIFGLLAFAEYHFGESEIYYILFLIFFMPLDFSVWVFLLIIAVPLVVVHTLSVSLAASEFVVRRIAESPKGPVLAASAVFAAVIAIFKTLGYS